MDAEKAKKHEPLPAIFNYNSRDTIIYALGIGATPKHNLHFVYENHENFQVFPTYAVAPGFVGKFLHNWPGIALDYPKILHGEQYIEQFEPLPAGDNKLRVTVKVQDILDKGTGALILFQKQITLVTLYNDVTNAKLNVQQFSIFQKGAGNFGGLKTSPHEIKCADIPKSLPDKVLEEKILENQAALYRQAGGDLNPLHIDTDFAKLGGFAQPILHGLCSLGIVTRQILEEYGENDTANFKAVKVRFSSPVIPGQTLVTETWKNGNRIHFQTKVKETNKIVLSNSYVDLNKISEKPKFESTTHKTDIKSDVIFKKINDELVGNSDLISKINAIVLYDITINGKHAAYYTLDLKNKPFQIYNNLPKLDAKPSVTVTVNDDDFVQLATGKLDGFKAFMSGRLKIKGNIMLMQKLQQIFAKARNTSKL